jgi:hypothetical protein
VDSSQEQINVEPELGVRIIRLNTDKTRKDAGSEDVYHMYFELTIHPPSEWARIFEAEWYAAHHPHKAEIDGGYLVFHSTLRDVDQATLTDLNTAVIEANVAYDRYARAHSAARESREDAWKHEREEVEALAKSLRFE